MGLWLPRKAWWYGAASGGHDKDGLSPDPFCPTSRKLSLATESGLTSKPGISDLFEFYIPFLRSHLPKFLLLLPCSTLCCGWRQAPGAAGATCCHVPSSGGTLGIPQHYGACLWGQAFRPSGNERMVSNSAPSRAMTVLAIRVVILHVTAGVVLVDPILGSPQRDGCPKLGPSSGPSEGWGWALLHPGSCVTDFTPTVLLWAGARGSELCVLGWRQDLNSADGDFRGFTGKTVGVSSRICSSFLALPQTRDPRYAAHSGTSSVCPLEISSPKAKHPSGHHGVSSLP